MASRESSASTIATALPPMPKRFGGSVSSSTGSRDSLRQDLVKRRTSLTPQEHGFLEQLATHGNEIEVDLAREKLADDTLFFEHEHGHNGWGNAISLGRETSDGSSIHESSPDGSHAVHSCPTNLASNRAPVVGSEKRQEHLKARRENDLHGKMWRAHESGLAVSKQGSQRSVMRRGSSVVLLRKSELIRNCSFLSTATKDLLLEGGPKNRAGEDEIFRGEIPKPDARPRSVSWGKAQMQYTIDKIPIVRMRSDGTRKSVSFSLEDPLDQDRRDALQRNDPYHPERLLSESDIADLDLVFESTSPIESYPGLQHAAPVRSDSMSSVPSLHHAHAVRADSILSIASLHHAESVHSDSLSSFQSDVLQESEATDAAWAAPLTKQLDIPVKGELLRHPAQDPQGKQKPMLLRRASRGEGIEVTEMDGCDDEAEQLETLSRARKLTSMVSIGDMTATSSFDDAIVTAREAMFRNIRKTLSDDEMATFFLGSSRSLFRDSERSNGLRGDEENSSWDMDDNSVDENAGHFDAWNILKQDPAIGFGGGDSLPFLILGTSAEDEASTPHVLSPPLMESLQNFLPYTVSEDNFWMKYSLIRDGASMHTLLQRARGAKCTILAVETVDGEVFGSFTSEPWRKNWNFFGSGEAFLWRMRQSRKTFCHSIIDQAHLESELDVFPWTGENTCVQLCTHDKIAVGGGVASKSEANGDNPADAENYGFGLAIEKDLLYGTSSSCATFDSPPLSMEHLDGSPFEIVNLELWTLTPCMTVEQAEKLELGKLFLHTN